MARRKRSQGSNGTPVTVFHHGDAGRLNIPDATDTQAGLSKGKKRIYRYSPHLSPKLQFDPSGAADHVTPIIEKALAGQKLTADEAEILRSLGCQAANPWLEWAAKQEQEERRIFAVDDVVLHIHERISAGAILATARREDVSEQDFFARPKLHQEQALQYYKHSIDWANRIVLGDSLQVMSSLASRESLSGQVQMIYFDPPYGISYKSNWQNELGQRTVRDKDEDLTREPEMIRAYRDTWTLGVHSYLTYLKQRLITARELLTDSGSIFVQISDENLHRVRTVMDEVFGAQNCIVQITFRTKIPLGATYVAGIADYLIWFAKDRSKMKFRRMFAERGVGEDTLFSTVEEPTGFRREIRPEENVEVLEKSGFSLLRGIDLVSSGRTETCVFDAELNGKLFRTASGKSWKTNKEGYRRLVLADRVLAGSTSLSYVFRHADYPVQEYTNMWSDTQGATDKEYVVQTATKVIERCMLMTTDPGDLVLDPTCGSGTTAFVAEQWGRRWITIDSSRIAISIARQRLLTALFESYKTKDPSAGVDPAAPQNPAYGFHYKTVPHITIKTVAQNRDLDPVFGKHEAILRIALADLNAALVQDSSLNAKLLEKMRTKIATEGARSISDADLRRWLLPGTDPALVSFGSAKQRAKWEAAIPAGPGWQEWEVPFDADPDWPEPLQRSLTAYRAAWRAKMDEVNTVIKANADQEELVDRPESVRGVSRVSGPFSIEGVRPEELALGEDGKLYDPTADNADDTDSANADGYIDLMISLLVKDGVTFLGNRRAEFASLEKEVGKSFHARGRWKGKEEVAETIAVVFGPQYGPINAPMTVEAIDAARGITEVTELVLAGFSFDAAAQEKAKEMDSSSLRIHLAHIRPDVSPGMQGLLKETPNSQLFTVFGQPDICVLPGSDGEVKVEMNGVCIYNPLTGEISESSNKKVAAWFLDSDYDGRCFCISQAFFPNKDAWEKIAKALGSSVSTTEFEDFSTSWPFKPGKHKRIAVKVIDPRGNEVIAIQTLND
jgi:adenine-specific DNA-methyltransferase